MNKIRVIFFHVQTFNENIKTEIYITLLIGMLINLTWIACPLLVMLAIDAVTAGLPFHYPMYYLFLSIFARIFGGWLSYKRQIRVNTAGEKYLSNSLNSAEDFILNSPTRTKEDIANSAIKLYELDKIRECFFQNILNILPDIILGALSLATIFFIEKTIGVAILSVSLLLYFFVKDANKKLDKSNRNSLSEWFKYFNLFTESVENNESLHGLNISRKSKKFLRSSSSIFIKEVHELNKLNTKTNTITYIAITTLQAAIMLIGIFLVYKNQLGIGGLLAISMLSDNSFKVAIDITKLSTAITLCQNSIELCANYAEENKNTSREDSKTNHRNIFDKENSISIKSLSFNNGEKEIFSNLNLSIKHRSMVLISGKSGVGKSTLARIIAGQETIENGIVEIGSRSKSNTSLLLYSPQKNHIFSFETGIENTLFSCQLSNFMVEPDLIKNIFDGSYFSPSGGELQRICLARIFSSDAEIVILDEPTSAMDIQLEKKIAEKIKQFSETKTIIVISHSNSFIKYADLHIELMGSGSFYLHNTNNSTKIHTLIQQ